MDLPIENVRDPEEHVLLAGALFAGTHQMDGEGRKHLGFQQRFGETFSNLDAFGYRSDGVGYDAVGDRFLRDCQGREERYAVRHECSKGSAEARDLALEHEVAEQRNPENTAVPCCAPRRIADLA